MGLRKRSAALGAAAASPRRRWLSPAAAQAVPAARPAPAQHRRSTSGSTVVGPVDAHRLAHGRLRPRSGHLDERRRSAVPQEYPQYAKTQVKVVWVPWGNRTTDWTNALSSGKNIPDITELGNTDTPTEAARGILAPLNSRPEQLVRHQGPGPRHARQRHPERHHLRRAVVRRRARRVVPHRPVQEGGHHRRAHDLGGAAGRRGEAAAGLPGHHRLRRAHQRHQRVRQLHLGRRRPDRHPDAAASGPRT